PCSSDVFIRIKRRNSTPPPSSLTFCFCNMKRSEARPKRYQNRHSTTVSW
ncbi:hypothetical protein PHMEG_00035895, partial [Phytophthora megakarya]